MGNAEKKASKVRNNDGSTIRIQFESHVRAFDPNHPIVGTVHIDAKQNIPAYGVILTLYMKDRSIKIDRGKNGEPYVHARTVGAFEKSQIIYDFPENVCPFGQSSYPFAF